MRKFFEGHSPVGVAIILSVFFLALFLRFYDLGSLSPWTDELASWWYLRNLDEVWKIESHSPLYYGLLRFFLGNEASLYDIRLFTATVSLIHLVECFFLGQLVFDKKRFLLFWILICLNPLDIIYARMARHYAWLLEGVLVFYLLMRARFPYYLLCAVATFMGFIHVYAVIPIMFLFAWEYRKNRSIRNLVVSILCASLILFYYLGRMIALGEEKVRSNLFWNSLNSVSYFEQLFRQFLGDAYPRFEFFPVNEIYSVITVILIGAFILYRRKESAYVFFGIFVLSVLTVEGLSLWVNMRVPRFLVYLSPLLLIALTDSFERVRLRHSLVGIIFLMMHLNFYNPLIDYPWDREKVEAWNEFQKKHPVEQKLVCANVYQRDYFKFQSKESCRTEVSHINFSRPVLFLDLNNNDRYLQLQILKIMDIEDFEPLKSASLVKFIPKAKKNELSEK